jgi:hypothetical protein
MRLCSGESADSAGYSGGAGQDRRALVPSKPKPRRAEQVYGAERARVDVAETIGRMILPGCLLVLLLPAGGAVLGKWLDGSEGGLWGLAIGFMLGFALAALSGWLLMRMKEE